MTVGLLKTDEAAEWLGVSRYTLARLVKEGEVRRLYVRRRAARYSVSDLEDYVRRCGERADADRAVA